MSRSSHQRCSVREGVLRNFTKFTGKHLCQSLFLIKFPCNFIKKRLWHKCFPVNFVKFLRTAFLQNTSWRLLLCVISFLLVISNSFQFTIILVINSSPIPYVCYLNSPCVCYLNLVLFIQLVFKD